MNVLGWIMGFLLIFACTFSLSLRKAYLTKGVEKTYQAHVAASRKILNSYESTCYNRMREEKKPTHPSEPSNKSTEESEEKDPIFMNRDCARLNLWPLLQDGKEKHLLLYETAAQLIRHFYAPNILKDQPRLEYQILNTMLDAAQLASKDPNLTQIPLEKLAIKGNVKQLYTMQTLYYRMLRGTKKTYPSLIDYIVFEKKKTRVCLHHASDQMFCALFGNRAGLLLQREVHESHIPLLPERIREVCAQSGKIGLNDEFLELLDLHSSRHHLSSQKILVEEDHDVCLKQRVFLPS